MSVVESKIHPEEYGKLIDLLKLHYAYPLPFSVSGAYFEDLFSISVGGEREKGKWLFDVYREHTGWSLKTKIEGSQLPDSGNSFEVVLKRSDILKRSGISMGNTAQELGNYVVEDLQIFYDRSVEKQKIVDPRTAFLIRNRRETDFIVFQQRYFVYEKSQIIWKWSNQSHKSIVGYYKDIPVLRWYRSGTQTFGIYTIPRNFHRFSIEWKRADTKQLLDFLERTGIVSVKIHQ